MVIFAPGGPAELLPASTGLIESCEIPAIFETRLVSWLETCDATSDSAAWFAGVALALLASVVCPNASRLIISASGSAGSELYWVRILSTGPWKRRLMLNCWIEVVIDTFITGCVSDGFTN